MGDSPAGDRVTSGADLANADEREIVRRVRGGDRQAYGELVRLHQRRLRSVISFYCSSAQETEELLQDAFVQAYTALDGYDATQDFFPWLRAIAMNILRAEARRRSRERRKVGEYLRHARMEMAEDDASGELASARADALRRCVGKLPEEQAALVRARYERSESLADLASKVGARPGALKVKLLRLRQALRACIERELGLARE